ncbi:MAG: aldehyde dehydrogenase family protein [Nitrospinae bacterium]|nr:aldehyde dehydrogenase family protein [Nitrospinota bacterium]
MKDYYRIIRNSCFINGQYTKGNLKNTLNILHKYNQKVMAEINLASSEQIEDAIAGSVEAFQEYRHWNSGQKADALKRLVHRLAHKKELFAHLIMAEAGKPLTYARAEVDRCISTLGTAVDEALRFSGEALNIDFGAGAGKSALTKRIPLGPVLAISPFNFPLNLALHKIGPALAAGCSIIVKPAPQSPLTLLAFADLLNDIGFPDGVLNIVCCDIPEAEKLVQDERIKMLSFTGSDAVGWHLKNICGKKKVALELGGNASLIIDETANLESAAKQAAIGAYLYAGQICISTQRIYVVEKVFDAFLNLLEGEIKKIKTGNPEDEEVINGPVIDCGHLNRINNWVQEAVIEGAQIITGGHIISKEHNLYAPTLLTDTKSGMKVVDEEAFGPVAIIEKVKDFHEAISATNNSKYGLQSGVYTTHIDRMKLAHAELEVGGVIINSIPGFRVDSMPYGGVKDSGLGREGIRYAIEEMTEPRLLVY